VAQFIARRAVAGLVTAFFVTAVTYALAPLGQSRDAAADIAGEFMELTPEELAARREFLGLDRPLYVQYLSWLRKSVFEFDLGDSLVAHQTVGAMIGRTIPVTFSLAVVAFVIMVLIAVPVGVVSAVKYGSAFDRAGQSLAAIGIATPHFVIGLILVKVVAVQLQWLPVIGFTSLREGFWEWLRQLILPAGALGLHGSAGLIRHVRAATLAILQRDYIRTATGKGLPRRTVLGKHAFKNALVPIATVLGYEFQSLLTGAVVIESVFALPGLGTLLVSSVIRGDYPTLVGCVLFALVVLMTINLVVDLIYAYANPKVRFT
jgi:peptide/nickel transport system permease protein